MLYRVLTPAKFKRTMLTIVVRPFVFAMHIPDGFLTPPVWITLDALAAPTVVWASRRSPVNPETSRIPLLGVMGAFVFAAQMINFPVVFGTSAHLLGGTLLGAVLGFPAAVLVMTSVLILQALMFQDGGVLALGANVFNMAIVGVAMGCLPIWLWGRRSSTIFAGGLFSVLTSGVLALGELSLSGIAITGGPLRAAMSLFLIAGIVEGAITVAAWRSILRLSPETPQGSNQVSFAARTTVAVLALVLVMGGAWIASAAPDSLQDLAGKLGLQENLAWTHAPFANYEWSDLGPEWLRGPAAGIIGLVCVSAICAAGGKRRQRGV